MQEITVKDIKELLEKVEKWTNAMEVRRRDGPEFNVFHLCSVDHYENAHSRIITEFLNPRASHGMGSVFLQYFLKCPNVLEHINQKGFPLELDKKYLDEMEEIRANATPEDTRVGMIQEWLDMTTDKYVCSRMIYNEVFASGSKEIHPLR